MELSRDMHMKCTDEANKEECDRYKSGECPYWRVYNYGGYVYNSMQDGLEGCECTEDSTEPHCTGYLPQSNCATCANFLAYNGRGNRMPDIPANYGCDGANSTYDELCDMWYLISHCTDLRAGNDLGAGHTGATLEMIQDEIDEETCDSSLHVAAYEKYLAYPPEQYEIDRVATTKAPVTAATEAPAADGSHAAVAAIGLMLSMMA